MLGPFNTYSTISKQLKLSLDACMAKVSIKNLTKQLSQFRTAVDSLPDSEELRALLEDIVPRVHVRRIITKHDEEYAEIDPESPMLLLTLL